jgi:glycosyltransferase involved in cell wall biosynthesis
VTEYVDVTDATAPGRPGTDLGLRASIVIPVYNEADAIVPCLQRIVDIVSIPFEVLVVYDSLDDSTVPFVEEFHQRDSRVRGVLNQLGPGPAKAIRAGFDAAKAEAVIVTMADGSDDPESIEHMVRLIERGCVIVAASRYMPGGAQVGGPWLKQAMSRTAGLSLYWLGRVGTRDATNSFKAYRRDWVETVGIESEAGFEIGIELVAKARRCGAYVAEVPTIWLDRDVGTSNFKLAKWLPRYLHWYRFAYGRRVTAAELGAASNAS